MKRQKHKTLNYILEAPERLTNLLLKQKQLMSDGLFVELLMN